MKTTLQVLQMIVLLKRSNLDLSTGYAFILISSTFGSLNTTVQVLQMIVLLKKK